MSDATCRTCPWWRGAFMFGSCSCQESLHYQLYTAGSDSCPQHPDRKAGGDEC